MAEINHYACQRATTTPAVDGDGGRDIWSTAVRTGRFVNAGNGALAFLNTEAALLWDDTALYLTFWLEERDVWSTGAPRQGLVWQENTVEVMVAGADALYSLSLSPAGQTEELLFIWKDAYTRGGRYDVPDLDLAVHKPAVAGGDGGPHHPRGMRWMFDDWHLPELQTAVAVDGTLDERHQIDRSWTAQVALPWSGMTHLLDGPAPPQPGTQLRVALVRHQVIDQRQSQYVVPWSWHVPGEAGPFAPEGYPVVELQP